MSDLTHETNPPPLHRHAHWALRLALASIFLYYGADKFLGGGIAEFAGFTGLPFGAALLVALLELAAGALVLAGAFQSCGTLTRIGAACVFPVMLGAIFTAHWGQWHLAPTPTHPMGGMGFQVTLLLVAVYLFIRGNDA